MDSYSIGLSGLDAAMKGLEVIGNNIANAATEGYHRQRLDLTPAYTSQVGAVLLGGGVEVEGVTRLIDEMLEKEILRQESSLGQISSEINSLHTVETSFAELSGEGTLSQTLDEFFKALDDLSANPTKTVWQNGVITQGKNLAGKFRTLADFLDSTENNVQLEAETTVEQINLLAGQIAEFNDKIERKEITGGVANNSRDQRDQLIKKLSTLIGVETQTREYGVVNVTASGIPLVTKTAVNELEIGLRADGKLGIAVAGADNYRSDIDGGRIGGLLTLKNDILDDIHTKLDNLASSIINKMNDYHVQGLGPAGSFKQLTGWTMVSEDLSDFEQPVTDGKVYIRVTDTSTGNITREEIDIDASTDSLTTIANYITNNITGLSASVNSSRLTITADATHEFDFLPAVLPQPTSSNLTGAPPPSISVTGTYTGSSNDTLQFTVSGTGSIGNGNLNLVVRDNGGAGEIIGSFNIGSGYAAGDLIDIANGIKVSLSTGDVNDGDTFEVDVFADSDTSGFLAAAGLNTFFSGTNARNIDLCSAIADYPDRLTTALGTGLTDNTNILRMAGLRDEGLSSLNDKSATEYYHQLVADIGLQLSVKQMNKENTQGILQSLNDHRSELSGVNINDEAAKMLIMEKMFQSMAKYITTVDRSLSTLMEIV